jgi:hypothetical protein
MAGRASAFAQGLISANILELGEVPLRQPREPRTMAGGCALPALVGD